MGQVCFVDPDILLQELLPVTLALVDATFVLLGHLRLAHIIIGANVVIGVILTVTAATTGLLVQFRDKAARILHRRRNSERSTLSLTVWLH